MLTIFILSRRDCGSCLVVWIAIATYEVLGTPFAYLWRVGLPVFGYELDYKSVAVGISGKRGQWLLEFLESFRRDGYTVYMRKFAEFLGRLSFVCRVLLWLRPHLAPLYSWSSALSKSTVATAPGLVKLTCRYLESQLSRREFHFSCQWPGRMLSVRQAALFLGDIVFCLVRGFHLR